MDRGLFLNPIAPLIAAYGMMLLLVVARQCGLSSATSEVEVDEIEVKAVVEDNDYTIHRIRPERGIDCYVTSTGSISCLNTHK